MRRLEVIGQKHSKMTILDRNGQMLALTLLVTGYWKLPHSQGGTKRPPLFFFGNYILYGVLVVICMYIPIRQVCMTIFRPPRFSPAAL